MRARHGDDDGLLILVALGDGERGERLMTSLAALGGITTLTQEDIAAGDHVDVAIVDDVATLEALPPGTPVVMLSNRHGWAIPAVVAVTLRADSDPILIGAAARLAAAGYRMAEGAADASVGLPREAENGAASDSDEAGGSLPVQLSPREAEVLALLAEGAPNKVIARRLDISIHTVKFHVAAILVKLGAANRTDAIAIAMRQGLVLV
ncbi:MAG: helix-turn-helix transcriptional regulator [Bradyrhizobium sp.]|uniref:helix-turn-helix transcriptional regulator n=1 Tax=Bradyrhizobium sp. TaxID=376 RepID=UPI002392245A|nr:helix-turn-helix transcriptional regulator [Bradyrhizobium sp.]MDE2602445.1 helix-turn-helix transcriptional regulator [Bradyrhizobium sp.]